MRQGRENGVLEIRNLSLSYGDADIVKNVSLSVRAGEILCIAGESGCGKSTLLKAIHGMDAVNVTGGDICYGGKSI
ncbi:MAG: ABC transporter ATP-binding protein [Lachnospiraceae bacterium]|nr:ABC transporter ATP-binding protein [Lachnospiraceae bacterium]